MLDKLMSPFEKRWTFYVMSNEIGLKILHDVKEV